MISLSAAAACRDATGLPRGALTFGAYSYEGESSTGQARGIQAGIFKLACSGYRESSTGQARGIQAGSFKLACSGYRDLHGTSPWHLVRIVQSSCTNGEPGGACYRTDMGSAKIIFKRVYVLS